MTRGGRAPRWRWTRRAALAAIAALALFRVGQACVDAIPATRAAGELGALLGLAGLGALATWLLREARTITWILVGLTLVVWAAGVLVPLVLLAHPRAVLYEGQLDGAAREATSPPSSRGGVYVLDVGPGSTSVSPKRGAYVLHVAIGEAAHTLAGALGEHWRVELWLPRSEPVHLSVERTDGPLAVRVRPSTLPWWFVTAAALLAMALAAAADAVGSRRRQSGLFAMAVAASALLAVMLDPESEPGARAVLGAFVVALFGGALFGGIVDLVGRTLRARSRWLLRSTRSLVDES